MSSLRNEALSRIGPDVELIVISTREDAVAELPQLAAAARPNLGQRPPYRLLVVDDQGSALREFFQWDQRPAEAES